MRKMVDRSTIAIDIDDVLAVQIPEFIKFSNQYYGTNLKEDEYNDDWPTVWGLPLEEALVRARRFHEARLSNFEKIEDAQPVLTRLSKKHKLVIVTARQAYNIDATHEWINKHFQNVFDETHFVPIWEPDNKISKADICRQIGANYLIDDQPKHCNLAADVGIKALLFGDYKWAKTLDIHKDVEIVDNWEKVGAYFNV